MKPKRNKKVKTLIKKQDMHIGWVDLLRIIACFVVVVAHASDPFTARFDDNPNEFLSGAYLGSLTRACVPLFVMITGILLLPTKMNMRTFYKKRAKRVLIPLIIWSIVTPVLYYLYLNFLVTDSANPGIIMENYTWQATLQKMYLFVLNFHYDIIPLWYMYMLVGLYLFMPVLSAWLEQASKGEMKCFLSIWLISTALPYLQMAAPFLGYAGNYGHMGLLGVCEWNAYGMFYYFSGFLGYLVLAHYLMRFPLNWNWKKTLGIAVPLFVAGYLITALGFILTQKYYPGSYANLEIIWYFSGINVLMMTFSIFVVVSKLKIKSSPILKKIASLAFGVYLCHFFMVQIGYDIIYTHTNVPPYLKIFAIAIIAFGLSLGLSWLLSLNKYTRKAIM